MVYNQARAAMGEPVDSAEYAVLRAERDLYLRLLDLGAQPDLLPFLGEALRLIVAAGGARQGYIELQDDDPGDTPRWSMAHGFSDEEIQNVRATRGHLIVRDFGSNWGLDAPNLEIVAAKGVDYRGTMQWSGARQPSCSQTS